MRDHQLARLNQDEVKDPNRIFLMLDQFSAHMGTEVLKEAERLNIELIFVPAGMTSDLQPLDVGVNSVLKAKQAKLYREAMHRDQSAPYKPEHAMRDLCAISSSISPSLIRKSWSRVTDAADQRV